MNLKKFLCGCGVGALVSASFAANAAVVLNEGFNGAGIPANWLVSPAVTVTAPINWAKPDNVNSGGVFAAQAGAPDSYLFNSFNSTPTSANMISDYLITPLVTVYNGSVLSFYVKADPDMESSFPDRLRVLMSLGGTTPASFTSLLLDINPTYAPTGFPTDWTMFSATVSGLTGATPVRFAFNYLINDLTTRGDFIGLDSVTVTIPEPGSLALLAIGLVGLGVRGRQVRRARN